MPNGVLNMSRKQGQLKTFETVAVLLILVFLFGFGLKFYVGVQIAEMNKARDQFENLNSVRALLLLSNMFELSCTQLGSQQSACMDKYKLQSVDGLLASNQRYFSMIGYASVTVFEMDLAPNPPATSPTEYKIYYVPLTESTGKDVFYLPLTIYNPINRTYNFGYMKLEKYR